MQKSLKKSLYLGLAALSFASVAGATNANAAKKHHSKKTVKTVKKAKPVTYTSSYNLDQSVVYSLNGSNAIYTKPGTVKGARVVASKSDVKSVANSSKGYFMAYGEAKTSKGAHYYKVVSFDHKYRGWVYAGSAKKVESTTTATDTPKNNVVYLKSQVSNTLWDAPKYSAFKTTKAANNNSAIANDQYVVDKAVKLNREGWTYYHVTNKTNANYSGWVWAGATSDAKPTDNFNAAKDVKINFTYNGSTVKSSVFHAYDANMRTNNSNVFNQDDLNSKLFTPTTLSNYNNRKVAWLNAQLAGTGYQVTDNQDAKGFDTNTHNYSALKDVKFGDTVYLSVVKADTNYGKLSAFALNNNQFVNGSTRLTADNVLFPAIYNNDYFYNQNEVQNEKAIAAYFGLQNGSSTPQYNDKLAGAQNALRVLVSKNNVTLPDVGYNKSVYKDINAAMDAYKAAIAGQKVSSVTTNVKGTIKGATNDYQQYNGYTLVEVKDANNSNQSTDLIVDGNNAVIATAKYGSELSLNNGAKLFATKADADKLGTAEAIKGATNATAKYNGYKLIKNADGSNGQVVDDKGFVVANINGHNDSQPSLNWGATPIKDVDGYVKELNPSTVSTNQYNFSDFAGINGGSKPYGSFDTSSNNTDSKYMKTATGANGEQYHMVYFLAPSATNSEMGNKKMADGVSFYYYAVPVAGPVTTQSNNTLDYLAK
ncbi:hypothetical protein FD06_GL001394 [Apilactobacillus ozensis DSM 23829 = JCM 17196]|uniref:S-layer protein n=1 Tax=Apilactobacillus ozensis DSM 23829 = JCM 17196 TaxID=1423781 RepID=A0A0R2AR33_9LACO|nr:hypothetical protein [Apilactobacillus ozensis]KRM68180.1 hypothetical protein FD06_GL001394 [Apilactobacillus ozensis DSM 23829 = JCM 17196]